MRKLFVLLVVIIAVLSLAYVLKSDDVESWAQKTGKEDFTFVVFGDSRPVAPTNPIPKDLLSRIAFEIGIIHPDFVVVTGDMIIGYGDSEEEARKQLQDFISIMDKYAPDVPFIFIPGNHELSSGHIDLYREFFGKKLYFDFYYGKTHLIFITTNWPKGYAPGKYGVFNVNDGEHEKAMVDWLKEVLAKPAVKKIVFGHVPAFSALTPNFEFEHTKSFDNKENRDEFVKLLVENGVDAYIAGHEHLTYITKKEDTLFITLGGGGAPVYVPVSGGYQVNLHVKPYNYVTSDPRVEFGGEASGYHYSLHVPAGAMGIFDYMLVSVKGGQTSYRLVVPFSFDMELLESSSKLYHVLVTNRTPYDIWAGGVEAVLKGCKDFDVKAYYVDWGRKQKEVEYKILEKKVYDDGVKVRIAVEVPATYAVHVIIEGK